MLQSMIHRFLRRRHFWRYATFDEVAELYASRTMRMVAQNMISLFVAVYLYQNGFSLLFIALYFAGYFLLRAAVSYPAARYAAYFGPKHGILVANLLYIPALVCFAFVPEYGIWAVLAFGFFQAWSMTMYDLSYLIDFSKVKHTEHAGKEIGFMQIFDRGAASLSPLVGGAVASFISPEATMLVSAAIFALASWPLFRTAEQTATRQPLRISGFPWKTTYRSIIAETAVGVDVFASNAIWVLFLSVVVFAGSSNDLYIKIGSLVSITIVTSFLAAYTFGRLIDRRRGGDLLRISTIADSLTHVFRIFVTGPVGVVAANVTNEVATTGYSMAFNRGLFDTADRSGHRVVYLLFIEVALNIGSMGAALVMALLFVIMPAGGGAAMQVFFALVALYVLLLMSARFPLYRK